MDQIHKVIPRKHYSLKTGADEDIGTLDTNRDTAVFILVYKTVMLRVAIFSMDYRNFTLQDTDDFHFREMNR